MTTPNSPKSVSRNAIAVSRRTFVSAGAFAAASVAAPSLWAQARPEKTKLAIAVGGKAAFYYLPLTISEQLGYFKAEGLDVEISDFAGGARPQIALGVSTKAMPNYKTLADLKGKKIGVSAPGSSTNMVANLVLSRGGLKASDVSFVGVGTSAGALAALRSGQIDAMSNTDPVMTMLEQKGDVRIISDTRTLKGTQEVFGGPMPAACLYMHSEFVQKNPNTCQALANAIVHGLKWLQTAGPSDIIKTVPDAYLLGDRALYLASFNKVREAISLDGIMPEEGTRTALKALASFDPAIKADKIELGKTYTNEFARRAKEKFKA